MSRQVGSLHHLRPTEKQDLPALLDLYASIFGTPKARLLEQRFHWQFSTNPLTPLDFQNSWLLLKGKDVVGHYGLIPIALKIGSETVQSSWACDYMVAPRHRHGKGFLELTRLLAKSSPFPMGYGMAEQVAAIYGKLGYRSHRVGGYLFKILRPAGWRSLLVAGGARRNQIDRLAWRSRAASRWMLARAGRRHQSQVDSSEWRVAAVDFSDERLDDFWQSIRGGYPIVVERNATYLRWRYQNHGRLFALHTGETILGCMVLDKILWRGMQAGLITEILFPRHDMSTATALLAAAEDYFSREDVDVILAEGFPPDVRRRFIEQGYLEDPDDWQWMVYLDRDKRFSEVQLERYEHWWLTAGDCDRCLGYQRLPWNQPMRGTI